MPEFFGETFELPERINHRVLTRFARAAARGANTDDMAAMALVDELIDQCLRPEDVDRFDEVCNRARPDAEQLLGFVSQVIEAIAERPTTPQSDSSPGLRIIETSSTDDSFDRVIARLEAEGRPDKAEFVLLHKESQAS